MEENILVDVRTDKSKYSLGEEVKMFVTVRNKAPNPVELVFSSAQHYEFIILKDDSEVWRWSNSRMFAMILKSLLLKPSEKQTYTETWKPKDADPGVYKVIGIITSRPPYKAACTFKINN